MFPFRKSLGFRLLVISIILLALPVLLDSFILMQRRYQGALQNAKNYLIEAANLRKLALLDIQPVNRDFLAIMRQYLTLNSNFPEQSSPTLEKQLSEFARIGNLFTILLVEKKNEGHFEIISSNHKQFIGKDLSKYMLFDTTLSPIETKEEYISRISYDPITLQPFFIVVQPIQDEERERVGFLIVTDTANLSDKLELLLAPDVKQYPIHFALVLPSSIVFAASEPSFQFHYFESLPVELRQQFIEKEPFAAQLLPEQAIAIERYKNDFFEFQWEKDRQLAYIKKVPNTDFSLLAYASKQRIMQSPLINVFEIYSSSVLILIIGSLVGYIVTRRMTKPIHQLAAVMQQLQKGNLQARFFPDRWGYEINQLGEIFNQTVDSLLEKKEKMKAEKIAKESYARELKLGQQVQRSLLPKEMPTYQGVELAAIYIPALEVGGDYYDLFVEPRVDGDKLYLGIADASGKGVQACFYSLGVRSSLRMYAKNSESIDHAMHRTNRSFNEDVGTCGMFITVWMADYHAKSKVLNYYSCGHMPPLLYRKNGLIEVLLVQDVAMGLLDASDKRANQVTLSEGDFLILYTDGVTEAHNERAELFGEERLIAFAKKNGHLSAKAFADKLVESVTLFAGKAAQHDDITLVIMKVVGS